MGLHNEIEFENDICEHLAANGWLYSADDDGYDRARALFPDDVLAWVQATQPKAWEAVIKNHGAKATETLLDRLRQQIDQRGTLDVLRKGVELLGLRKELELAQFKPALAINEDILAKYRANRLCVMRQVHYSLHNENSIDLVLFLNGLPVATAELKSDFTQSVEDAVDQYRNDRDPRPKGKTAEPLLSFPGGALVHFAVSNSEVRMTTKLKGTDTGFLPFNLGQNGAAGNPPNPNGHETAYLWEQVWERESWLEILGRYLMPKRDEKKQLEGYIFPRFHQLDVTRKLQRAILNEGPGGKYLIQHSAGSGKTNSIAWSAHFLADLHYREPQRASGGFVSGDATTEPGTQPGQTEPAGCTEPAASALPLKDNDKVFDSVLVISDRNVIDSQLQDAIFAFERTTGVVATIKGESASKSGELAAALSGDKKVVVCTIQTFPFAMQAVRELAATQGKRFAVIADEAHSSQTGEAASKLKAVLSAEELKELGDGGEVSTEDLLTAQMAARAKDSGITYVAFTATPKAKTLELFGRRPDPNQPASADNLPQPFHVYSMRQAIEEGFILDVLKNYTPYKLAFKLAYSSEPQSSRHSPSAVRQQERDGSNGDGTWNVPATLTEFDEKTVDRAAAMKGVMGWVKLHPYNIAQKVQVVVEHYREHVAPLLNGKAKAMVVVSSRKEAVRWKLAIDNYIRDQNYSLLTLVAFSGEVDDKESGPEPFTENSKLLNPKLNGRDIREAFKGDEYQILLVANKFQTGFDQPLLCGMYIDKRLAGIQAVQTLSRLNRAHPGKDTTYVLDFVNDTEEILAAFKTYYTTAELADVTDPNLVYNLRAKLDIAGHYDDFEVDRVVRTALKPTAKQSELKAAIEPTANRIVTRYKTALTAFKQAKDDKNETAAEKAKNELDALILFKTDMATFLRLYTFLSQIFDYGNTDIEKRSIFFHLLLPLLEFGREREGIDLSKVVLTHHNLKSLGKRSLGLHDGEIPKLQPLTETGSGSIQEKQKALMSEIIAKLNEVFAVDCTDQDLLNYARTVRDKMLESKTLQQQAANNTEEQFASSPDLRSEITNAAIETYDIHTALSSQLLNSDIAQTAFMSALLKLGLYEALRSGPAKHPA